MVGRLGIPLGSRLCAGDRRLNVALRAVDIAVKIKLQNNAGAAERAGGGHLTDPGNPPQGALQRWPPKRPWSPVRLPAARR